LAKRSVFNYSGRYMRAPDNSRGEDEKASRKSASDAPHKRSENERVGGFAFFLSLILLLPTGLVFFIVAIRQIRDADIADAAIFILAAILGMMVAHGCIRDHISVLIHEFKHSLISNLAGNKYKGMKIDRNSGHMEYAYTKRTAHYNAFISLAPYIVPIFTTIFSLIALSTSRHDPTMMVLIVGFGYGIDLLLNMRDISPIQTDISLIRGGYHVGLLYILAWNLVIAALALAWAFQGIAGIGLLFKTVCEAFIWLYFSLSGQTPGGEGGGS